jgi:sec-independent protein translocase protein TatC
MTIWEHVAELRSRLIKCAIAVAIGALIGWFLTPAVLEFIQQPYVSAQAAVGGDARFLALDPLEPFMVRLKLASYIGIAFAMPVVLWQVWRFVTPGLYPHEKKYAIPFVASSLALFLMGASIAYYTLDPALAFLTSIAGDAIVTQYSPEKYVTLVLYMMLAFGAGFEFPVLLVALQMIGILKPRQLVSYWRTATVIIAVVAAVITPSQDPISMAALAVPMFILYWGAIGVGALFLKLRNRKEKAAGGATPAST